jgi:limonene-1,2-epoxide hydrolase
MAEREEVIVREFLDVSVKGDIMGSLGYFADGASYRINAWNEPLVGIDAIRADFERQRALWSDFRYDLLNIASAGRAVFTERIDTVHMTGKDLTVHAVGVFEVDSDGKITSWRDYFDMKEIEAQLAGRGV